MKRLKSGGMGKVLNKSLLESKICSKCGIEKSLIEFYKNRSLRDGHTGWCKGCIYAYRQQPKVKRRAAEYGAKYRKKPEVKKRRIAWKAKYNNSPEVKKRNAKRIAKWWLLKNYGITPKQRQEMIVNQGGKCAICGEELDMGRNTQIDHDHDTGKIRGILCVYCNMGLGGFRDNKEYLAKATRYLERSEESV